MERVVSKIAASFIPNIKTLIPSVENPQTGNPVDVFKNPTTKELKEVSREEGTGTRAFLDGNDIYVWEGALHRAIQDQLKLSDKRIPLDVATDGNKIYSVRVTDHSKRTKWYHDPEVEEVIKKHPFIKLKADNDFNVEYYDEAIVGPWDENKTALAEKSDYLVREDGPNEYTITKWTGGDMPESTYKLVKRNNKWQCDCMGFSMRKTCKHIDILHKWIKEGKPESKMIEAQFTATFKDIDEMLQDFAAMARDLGFSEADKVLENVNQCLEEQVKKNHVKVVLTPKYKYKVIKEIPIEEAEGAYAQHDEETRKRYNKILMERGRTVFKDKLRSWLAKFIKTLVKLKTKHPWLEIEPIVQPFTKLKWNDTPL